MEDLIQFAYVLGQGSGQWGAGGAQGQGFGAQGQWGQQQYGGAQVIFIRGLWFLSRALIWKKIKGSRKNDRIWHYFDDHMCVPTGTRYFVLFSNAMTFFCSNLIVTSFAYPGLTSSAKQGVQGGFGNGGFAAGQTAAAYGTNGAYAAGQAAGGAGAWGGQQQQGY